MLIYFSHHLYWVAVKQISEDVQFLLVCCEVDYVVDLEHCLFILQISDLIRNSSSQNSPSKKNMERD